jgi:hypothetical protein
MLFRSFLFASALTVLAASGSATVLTFDLAGATDYTPIPQEYGDNVTATTMGGFSYGAGGGFTPDVNVGYFGSPGSQSFLNIWTTGYNDLTNVAEYEPDGEPTFGFTFDGTNGQAVRLESFDLGNYGGAVTVPGITITDGTGNVLWSQTQFALPASSNPGHLTFSPNVTATSLRMTVDVTGLGGNSDNVGFDNIRFSQQPVPEPASLTSLGLGGLAFLRRRRKA